MSPLKYYGQKISNNIHSYFPFSNNKVSSLDPPHTFSLPCLVIFLPPLGGSAPSATKFQANNWLSNWSSPKGKELISDLSLPNSRSSGYSPVKSFRPSNTSLAGWWSMNEACDPEFASCLFKIWGERKLWEEDIYGYWRLTVEYRYV